MLRKIISRLFRRASVEDTTTKIQYLKDNGIKISFNVDDCIISPYEITEEIQEDPLSEATMLDGLIGKDNVKQNRIDASYIVCYYNSGADKVTFISPVIYKDKITLGFLLQERKSLLVYVNRTNSNKYYFDLEFLS